MLLYNVGRGIQRFKGGGWNAAVVRVNFLCSPIHPTAWLWYKLTPLCGSDYQTAGPRLFKSFLLYFLRRCLQASHHDKEGPCDLYQAPFVISGFVPFLCSWIVEMLSWITPVTRCPTICEPMYPQWKTGGTAVTEPPSRFSSCAPPVLTGVSFHYVTK